MELSESLTQASEDRRRLHEAESARAMGEVEAALKAGERAVGVSGLVGAATALFVARLVHSRHRPVVVVAPDEARAALVEHDLRFFLGRDASESHPRLLRLPADDLLPYDDLSPDRALVQERLRALFHLHLGTKIDAVVTSGPALARRVMPKRALDRKAFVLAKDQDVSTDELKLQLVLAGYENVPLVEDPGSFAVRGGIVDAFSPLYSKPARLEFFGDTIETIKLFDPDTQRTIEEIEELAIAPAREVLFDDASKQAATNAIRALADEVHKPSAKVRELLEEVQEGIPAFGLEALLPAFYPEGLASAFDYLPKNALYVLDDPLELQRAVDALDTELAHGFNASRERGDLSFEPQAHFLSADAVQAALAQERRIELQSLVFGEIGSFAEEGSASPPGRAVASHWLAPLSSWPNRSSFDCAQDERFGQDERGLRASEVVRKLQLSEPPLVSASAHPERSRRTSGNGNERGRAAAGGEADSPPAASPSAGRAVGPAFATAPLVARFHLEPTHAIRDEILAHHGESGALEPLWRRLSDWRQTGIAGIVACHTAGQAEKLKRMLLDRNVMARLVPALPADPASLYQVATYAHIVVGELSSGFVDRAGKFAIVTDADIFGERTERKVRKTRAEQPFVAAFRDLNEGDLVVHVEHGIARYEGLTKLSVRGVQADFLVLAFAGKDKLYLPVHRLRQIQKYVGGDPETVRLDSLKSNAFVKRKQRVKEELLRMAAELLELYASRKAHPGHAYSPTDEMFGEFEADFEFEETPDQATAIDQILADMQKPEPMDRLVCGDVGYGKTEVAMRAAFKAIEDHKQVAVLVPTTVLAAQHLHTFQKRMKDYPVVIEMVSRFRDAKAIKDVLKRTAEGKVDIIIGTHRLLSPDVSFKDLGLVVIDEEHRFGVKHKERLKHYRKLVDVMTMSATPIPRTLQLSLGGMRDMSIIATPPTDRRAIRTFVSKFDPAVVKEAIEREVARGGQVYFLHNRVESIEELRRFTQELCPTVRIEVGHAQMPDGALEEVMTRFVERKFDVLICTTIIESGLDIPSANTMLVNRADTFGLAQLYQIRGRVGRSRERAYCYLFVPAERPVTKDAKKRLQVLQQFSELGAGFHIASHDMEIRGAGNLLGPDQSGNINAVGFDLYAELMDEAVRELRGEPPREEIDPDVALSVPAYIPDDYVPDVTQRLLFYKRLAQAPNDDELFDIRAELIDRNGEAPPEVENLVQLMSIKSEMRKLKLRALESGPGRLVVTLGADAKLDPLRMAQLVARSKEGLKLTPEMKLIYPVPAAAQGETLDLLAHAHKMMQALQGIRAEG